MLQTSIRDELLALMNGLSREEQQRVLEFTRSLSSESPKGTPGKDLLHLAGSISPEDARQIAEAVEEECEQIDYSKW